MFLTAPLHAKTKLVVDILCENVIQTAVAFSLVAPSPPPPPLPFPPTLLTTTARFSPSPSKPSILSRDAVSHRALSPFAPGRSAW